MTPSALLFVLLPALASAAELAHAPGAIPLVALPAVTEPVIGLAPGPMPLGLTSLPVLNQAPDAAAAMQSADVPSPQKASIEAAPQVQPKLDVVRYVVGNGRTLPEVEEYMKRNSLPSRDRKWLAGFLPEAWKKSWADQAAPWLTMPVGEAPGLPTVTVTAEGVAFKLHPLVHGFPASFGPNGSASNKLKTFIGRQARSYRENAEPYYAEENFSYAFPELDRKAEIKDTSETSRRSRAFLLFMKWTRRPALLLLNAIARHQLSNGKLADAVASSPELALDLKALADPSYQAMSYIYRSMTSLPEPLGLQLDHFKEKKMVPWFVQYVLKPLYNPLGTATATERSLYTAEQLKSRAAQAGARVVHYIGGADHIPQIAYFLTHTPQEARLRLSEAEAAAAR